MKYTDKELENIVDKLASSTRSPKGIYSSQENYKHLEKRLFGKQRFLLTRKFVTLAAAVALIGVLGFSAYHYYNSIHIITVSTLAEVKEITLPDGSAVTLNHHSTLSYSAKFNEQETRNIELSGGAYFDVTKDKEHPFIVQTNDVDIKVLGTQFNVDAYPKDSLIKTTLLEGSVAVSSNNTKENLILEPGQSAVYNKENISLTLEVAENVQDYIAWRNGNLIFSNISLAEITRTLSNSFNVPIVFDDPELANYKMSGKFTVKDGFDKILQIMKNVCDFEYTRTGEVIHIKTQNK